MKHTVDCVGSSNLARVDYDSDSLELTVIFSNGSEYVYEGVNEDEWEGMLEASSRGSFLNKEIKPNHNARRVS